MKLSDLGKTLKENAAAIITALIVFFLIANYLFFMVPKNEQSIDEYNTGVLQEFGTQFNNTLNDYATQVDLDQLKDNIRAKAVKTRTKRPGKQKATTTFYYKDSVLLDSVLGDIKNNIIIQSIRIDSVLNEQSHILLYKQIELRFSNFTKDLFSAGLRDSLSKIKDTSIVKKSDLKSRLNGSIQLKSWMIYTPGNKKTILENGIDPREADSISNTASPASVLTFKFSDKRFYKKAYTFENTDYTVMLVGAVSQQDVEAKKKKVSYGILTLSILFVLLLFLSIPMIKPLISSAKEKFTQFDLLSSTFAVAAFIITLVCFFFSGYLFNKNNFSNREELDTISANVRNKLSGELSIYKAGLDTVAVSLQQSEQATIHTSLHDFPSLDTNSIINKYLQNYFNFNAGGEIVRDISKDENFVIRKNYKDRPYFKILQSDTSYHTILTAVYSKYDNKYKLVYVKKDIYNSLSGFAYAPQFMALNRPNSSNGYLLCSASGRVLLHSDSTKSLNENIVSNSLGSPELSRLFHGISEPYFEMDYNGNQCLFYAQRLNISDYPVFLLTYKNLENTNKLKVYTIINSFMLSVAYGFFILLLVLLYSVYYYTGDISIVSRFHFHWLFPDNSRKKEYIILKWANYSCFAAFILCFLCFNDKVIYFALLTGINLAFFNFVILNQRSFLLDKSSFFCNKNIQRLLAYILIISFLLPVLLYIKDFYTCGFSISVVSHFIYTWRLKKRKKLTLDGKEVEMYEKYFPDSENNKSSISKRPYYISFFSSVVSYHFVLIPALLTFGLFCNEMNKQQDYYYSAGKHFKTETPGHYSNPNEPLYNIVSITSPPSAQLLENLHFYNLAHNTKEFAISEFVLKPENIKATLLLLFILMVILLLVNRLNDFYAGRFFFFELSEAYRTNCFPKINEFTNFKIIIPPYNDSDLRDLNMYEKYNPDIAKEVPDCEYELKGVPAEIISNQVKLDLIMNNNLETYKNLYLNEWGKLDEEEKFVMSDFAVDYFVNYKNRNVVIRLMKKGYIIADPLTGRLRVMNYGFRNFIADIEKVDPVSAAIIQKAEAEKGTFSKWRLPIAIVALSILLLMMYIFKASFDKILLFGGSIISAMGLIAKFMDTYKK